MQETMANPFGLCGHRALEQMGLKVAPWQPFLQ
jgi:hypothetical protein